VWDGGFGLSEAVVSGRSSLLPMEYCCGDRMSEVKVFRIKGRVVKPNYKTEFSKEIRATTPEAAVEKIYASFGSQHRVKRVHIRVESVQEITPEETTDASIRQLSGV